jgi:hypothetical protein
VTLTADPPSTETRESLPINGKPNDDDKWWAAFLLIDDNDVARADAYWQRHASPMFNGLLSGQDFYFDEQEQQYYRKNGRAVDEDEIRWLFLAFLTAAGDEMEMEAAKMAGGEMPLADWQWQQAAAVKDLYIASDALGVGGIDGLTETDLQDVEGVVGESGLADALVRLRRFGNQIEESGETAGTAKQIVHRAGQYALPAHTIQEEARRASHIRARDGDGKLIRWQELNVLTPADHCNDGEFTVGCWECTQAGWQDIGTLPSPGLRTCNVHCKCYLRYRLIPPTDAILNDPHRPDHN